MKQRAVWCAALAAALLCLALPARADKEAITLDYEAGAGCPDREQFIERVHTFTSKAEIVSDDNAPRRKFGVRVVRVASAVRGELTIDDQGVKTTRSVSGATCDEVISALALATAIAVDPDALGGPQPSPPTKPPSEPPVVATKPSASPAPHPPPAPPSPARKSPAKPRTDEAAPHALYASIGSRGGDAIAPFLMLEVTGQLGVSYFAPVDLYVGGAYGWPQENAQVRFTETVGWLGAGYRLVDLEPLSVSVQGAFEYGQVDAAGRDVVPVRSVRRPWAAVDVGLSGRVDWPGPLFIQGNIGGRAPLTLQRYVVTENTGKSQELYQVGQLGYLMALSVGVHFL